MYMTHGETWFKGARCRHTMLTWAVFRLTPILLALMLVAGCGGGGGGGGGGSSSLQLSAISPSAVSSGSSGLTLTLTGSGFVPQDIVTWGGYRLTTTYVSTTELQVQVPQPNGVYPVGPGLVQINVLNPAVGGSNFLELPIGMPVSAVTEMSPSETVAGSMGLTVTLRGAGFVSSDVVEWNGSPLDTHFVSRDVLEADVPASAVANAASASVAVVDPAYVGSVSNALAFKVRTGPTPGLTLDPESVASGEPGLVLTVNGSGFSRSSTVQWNGNLLTTTWVSADQLQAEVPANLLATVGMASVTVAGTSTSSAMDFFVGEGAGVGFAFIDVSQEANDVVWSAQQARLYLSVPSNSTRYPNSIVALDPYSLASAPLSQYAGSNPDVLALSSDGLYLYAGIQGAAAMSRFLLPGLTPDTRCSLGYNGTYADGPNVALDIEVSPSNSHTAAVATGEFGLSPEAQLFEIMDDCTARPNTLGGVGSSTHPNAESIQWDPSATTIFGTDASSFYTFAVDANGLSIASDHSLTFTESPWWPISIVYNPMDALIYSDDGQIVDPTNGQSIGDVGIAGVMAVDAKAGLSFFATVSPPNPGITITAFSLATDKPVGSIRIPSGVDNPLVLIRWGSDGLAMTTDDGQTYLIAGSFVTTGTDTAVAGTMPSGPSGVLPAPPTPPAPPSLTALNPSSVASTGESLPIQVTGTGFVPDETVEFNGNAVPTSYVSSTELKAILPATDLVRPGAASIKVAYTPVPEVVSDSLTLMVGAAPASVDMLSPAYTFVGSHEFTLTVLGRGFSATSAVEWNGQALPTTFVTQNELEAVVPATDLTAAGTATISVGDPGFSGGASVGVSLAVKNTAPTYATLNPSSAVAGSGAIVLTVNDKNFTSSSTVSWNGTPLATTYLSANQLQAAVPSNALITAGTASVTVSSGLSTTPLTFFIGTQGGFGYAYVDLSQPANDIVWSPVQQQLYLSTPATASVNPSSLIAYDPYTFSVSHAQSLASAPNLLAVSDDGTYLYTSVDGTGSIDRFILPGFAADTTCSLGTTGSIPNTAKVLQVAPGSPHTTAVTIFVQGAAMVMDDCITRANTATGFAGYYDLVWGSDNTHLYAAAATTDFAVLDVNSGGVTQAGTYPAVVGGVLHFDPTSGYVYSQGGATVDPATGAYVGTYGDTGYGPWDTVIYDPYQDLFAQMDFGIMVPDGSTGKIYFAARVGILPYLGASYGVSVYDQTHFTPNGALIMFDSFSFTTAIMKHVVRWGTNGLAITTSDGRLYLVAGTLIGGD